MSDELVEGGAPAPNAGNVIPGEAPAQVPTGEPMYKPHEIEAIEQGWIPKDQWKGDPEEHRSAREFLERGELLGKLKSQGSQLREVTDMLKHLAMHNQRVYEASYKDAIKALTAQKYQAVQEGDVQKVAQIDQQLDQHKVELIKQQQQANQPAQPSAEFNQWVQKNDWFAKNGSLRYWAQGMAIEFARVNPGVSEGEILQFLEKEVRKEFPHKFGRQAAPNPDAQGRQGAASGRATGGASVDAEFEKIVGGFDDQLARAARNLVKYGHVTKEDYVKQFKDVNARGR